MESHGKRTRSATPSGGSRMTQTHHVEEQAGLESVVDVVGRVLDEVAGRRDREYADVVEDTIHLLLEASRLCNISVRCSPDGAGGGSEVSSMAMEHSSYCRERSVGMIRTAKEMAKACTKKFRKHHSGS